MKSQNQSTARFFLCVLRVVIVGVVIFSLGSFDRVHAAAPVLTITKTHIAGSFTQGLSGNYTITVTNNGNAPTSGTVRVDDTLPPELTGTDMSGSGWNCTAPPATEWFCTRADALAAGNSFPPITMTVDIDRDTPTAVVNSVTVSGGGSNPSSVTDPTLINQADLIITNLTVTSFDSGSDACTSNPVIPVPNQTFCVKATVLNQGLAETYDVPSVDIFFDTDPLTVLGGNGCPPQQDYSSAIQSLFSLGAGASDVAYIKIEKPGVSTGLPADNYLMWAYVDSDCTIVESIESGNNSKGPVAVNISHFGPISQWTNAFDLSHGWTVSQYVRTVGDVNGDGMDDLVGFGLDGVYIAISTGSGFGPISQWTNAFDLSHGWTVSQYVRTVGDVNGDGKDDLVGFGLDGVYVALSTGSGFGPISQWTSAFDLSHGWTVSQYERTVGDVNGDGMDDLVGFGLDGVYVALSNGSSFDPVSQWTSAFDLSHGWTVSQYERTVGDVNGDGKDDLVGFGLDGVYVALSNGSSFDPVSQWTSAFDLTHGWTVSDYERTVGDVNGDGKADPVGFGLDGVYVALSNGSSFDPISQWTNAFDLSHGWTVSQYERTVGDVSGDGRADLVGFGLDGVYVAIAQ